MPRNHVASAPALVTVTCPDWCTTNHSGWADVMEENEYRERVHCATIGTLLDQQGKSVAEAGVVRRDNVDTGEIGSAAVSALTNDLLEGALALRFAEIVMQAAAFAEEANRAA